MHHHAHLGIITVYLEISFIFGVSQKAVQRYCGKMIVVIITAILIIKFHKCFTISPSSFSEKETGMG